MLAHIVTNPVMLSFVHAFPFVGVIVALTLHALRHRSNLTCSFERNENPMHPYVDIHGWQWLQFCCLARTKFASEHPMAFEMASRACIRAA